MAAACDARSSAIAAPYAFRNHDDILDEVTSAYERRRRAATAPMNELATAA